MRAMKIQLEEVASKNNASVLVAAQLVTGSPVDWYFLIDGKFYTGYHSEEIESQLSIKTLHDLKGQMINPVDKVYLHTNTDNLADSTLISICKIR